MEKYELNKYLLSFNDKLEGLNKALKIDEIQEEIENLTKTTEASDFWNDQKKSQEIFTKLNFLKDKLNSYNKLNDKYEDLKVLVEMNDDEPSDDLELEIENETLNLVKEIDEFEIVVLLNGKYDNNNAIMELHPGAGGTESQDWCEMLYRMYLRYAQRKNYKIEIIDYQSGEEAGIKSVTILVKGLNAYGYLKAERGVHRLVRISPFDSNARRHTSFCSVDVAPQIDDKIDVKINDEDIKIDVYRSSGAGGQSVNTTDSAVRITHKPTGIVVTCQNERSQIKNREVALNVLKSKLVMLEIKKQEEELKNIKGEQMDIAWGSQIRSYVFHPYSMVKDHRSNYETGNTNSVMDGDIDEFIKGYLKMMVSFK